VAACCSRASLRVLVISEYDGAGGPPGLAVRGLPHSPQNFIVGAFPCWHWGQCMPSPPSPERGQGSTDNRPLKRLSFSRGIATPRARHPAAILAVGSTRLSGVWDQILGASPPRAAPALGPDYGRHLLEGARISSSPVWCRRTPGMAQILAKSRGRSEYTARSCPSNHSIRP